MTDNEKLAEIVNQSKIKGWDIDSTYIPVLVIIGYLDKLRAENLIETAFTITPMGEGISTICGEFDYKPSDKEIFEFVNEMVDKEDHKTFCYLLIRYRDEREELLEQVRKNKNTDNI